MLLLFTSCVSNNSRTGLPIKSNKNLEVTVREQGIEFKKLQEDNKELREEIENLNKRIQKIEDFYELN
jgi:predicted RNase H-like nuclease (RuvC/YqgF family)